VHRRRGRRCAPAHDGSRAAKAGAGLLAKPSLRALARSAAAATPRAQCNPGSQPETDIQGRVPPGAPADGFRCNPTQVGHEGTAGG